MAIMSSAESVFSVCLAKSGTKNQNQPDKTGLSKINMNNDNTVCKTETPFLAKAPVAQMDRASVYETEGYTFESCQVHYLALTDKTSKLAPNSHNIP